MIPDGHQRLSAQAVRENVSHAYGKGGRATGAVVQSLLTHGLRQRLHFGGRDWKSPVTDDRSRSLRRLANNAGRAVDGEIDPRLKNAGSDHRHDGDHGFCHHSSVSNHAGFGLAADQFWGGAAGNQRVKAADRATSDGNECERKNVPGKHGARAVNEARERRHVQRRPERDDTKRQ